MFNSLATVFLACLVPAAFGIAYAGMHFLLLFARVMPPKDVFTEKFAAEFFFWFSLVALIAVAVTSLFAHNYESLLSFSMALGLFFPAWTTRKRLCRGAISDRAAANPAIPY